MVAPRTDQQHAYQRKIRYVCSRNRVSTRIQQEVVSALNKLFFFALGWLCVVAGVVGIFLPILPTTPFLLVAAWAFAKSSPRFQYWLESHQTLGPYIYDWRHYGVVPIRAKILAISMMTLSFSWLVFLSGASTTVVVVVGLTMAGVATFLLTRPSSSPEMSD